MHRKADKLFILIAEDDADDRFLFKTAFEEKGYDDQIEFVENGIELWKLPEHLVEDIRQETLLRVLGALRGGKGLKRPECLGSFALAVCQNVMREFVRAQSASTVSCSGASAIQGRASCNTT